MKSILSALIILALSACSPPKPAQTSVCNEFIATFECVNDLGCNVPLPTLLSAPRCFSGKRVWSTGYIAHQDDGTRLYLTKDAASQYFIDQSVQLELIPNSKGWPIFQGPDRYLRVSGVVQSKSGGRAALLVSRPGHIATQAVGQ